MVLFEDKEVLLHCWMRLILQLTWLQSITIIKLPLIQSCCMQLASIFPTIHSLSCKRFGISLNRMWCHWNTIPLLSLTTEGITHIPGTYEEIWHKPALESMAANASQYQAPLNGGFNTLYCASEIQFNLKLVDRSFRNGIQCPATLNYTHLGKLTKGFFFSLGVPAF